jgi:hypothetical protein
MKYAFLAIAWLFILCTFILVVYADNHDDFWGR